MYSATLFILILFTLDSGNITKLIMIFYIGFFLIFSAALIAVTMVGKDFYPFSHYPMFSKRFSLHQLVVYRIQLEFEHGSIEWMKSKFYRYPGELSKRLAQLHNKKINNAVQKEILCLQESFLLEQVLKTYCPGKENFKKKPVAIKLIQRSIDAKGQIVDLEIKKIKLRSEDHGNIF